MHESTDTSLQMFNNLLNETRINDKIPKSLNNEKMFKHAINTMRKLCECNINLCYTDSSIIEIINKLNLGLLTLANTSNIGVVSTLMDQTKQLNEKIIEKQSLFGISQIPIIQRFMTDIIEPENVVDLEK